MCFTHDGLKKDAKLKLMNIFQRKLWHVKSKVGEDKKKENQTVYIYMNRYISVLV